MKMTLKDIKRMNVTHLAPNQLIIATGDTYTLMSYSSVIVAHVGDKTYLGKNWKYSKTTSKYRSRFLGETTAETQAKLDEGIYLPLGDS